MWNRSNYKIEFKSKTEIKFINLKIRSHQIETNSFYIKFYSKINLSTLCYTLLK